MFSSLDLAQQGGERSGLVYGSASTRNHSQEPPRSNTPWVGITNLEVDRFGQRAISSITQLALFAKLCTPHDLLPHLDIPRRS